MMEDIVRIGDKVISRKKIDKTVDKILELRQSGLSQQEVALSVNVDRSFVSRLESIGEIRKGSKIALIGFPLENKDEILEMAREEGVDYACIMTDDERWGFVDERNGASLVNDIMQIISLAQGCDVLIMIGSDMRIEIAEALIPGQVIGVEIGKSPIKGDIYVDPKGIRDIIRRFR